MKLPSNTENVKNLLSLRKYIYIYYMKYKELGQYSMTTTILFILIAIAVIAFAFLILKGVIVFALAFIAKIAAIIAICFVPYMLYLFWKGSRS